MYSDISSLIIAFLTEFHLSEDVGLVIKTHGGNPNELSDRITKEIKQIHGTLRLYGPGVSHPDITIITSFLPHKDLMGIHDKCDCFVMPSHGESLCIPVLNAMYLGNKVIVTRDAGMDELNFGTGGNIYSVESHQTPCVCVNPPLPYLYSARETWANIDILGLCRAMRDAYSNPNKHADDNKQFIEDSFSYEATARKLAELL